VTSPTAPSDYHEALSFRGRNVVILRRTPTPFPDGAAVRREAARVQAALDRVGRSGRGLLVDSRRAPHGTDGRLSREFAEFRRAIRSDFRAIAILVRTKVGVLQATRLKTEDGMCAEGIFDDESAAIAYLESATR